LSDALWLLRYLPSLPTRRSSDLVLGAASLLAVREEQDVALVLHVLRERRVAGDLRHGGVDRRDARARRVVRIALRERSELPVGPDRKSTRLNSSHVSSSYAVLCL